MVTHIGLALVYAAVLFASVFAIAYIASSSSVFGTSGHKSSEFKLTLFAVAAACMFWSAAAAMGATAGVGESWLALGVILGTYNLGRALVKRSKK